MPCRFSILGSRPPDSWVDVLSFLFFSLLWMDPMMGSSAAVSSSLWALRPGARHGAGAALDMNKDTDARRTYAGGVCEEDGDRVADMPLVAAVRGILAPSFQSSPGGAGM